MFESYSDVLTVNQAREMIKIGRNSIYSLLQSGEISYFLVGKNYRIPKKSIIEYVEKQVYNMCEKKFPELHNQNIS